MKPSCEFRCLLRFNVQLLYNWEEGVVWPPIPSPPLQPLYPSAAFSVFPSQRGTWQLRREVKKGKRRNVKDDKQQKKGVWMGWRITKKKLKKKYERCHRDSQWDSPEGSLAESMTKCMPHRQSWAKHKVLSHTHCTVVCQHGKEPPV